MPGAPGKVLFYPAVVAAHGRAALRWGPACDTAAAAKLWGRTEVDAGNASVAFVVRFGGGEKTPMAHYVYPMAARRVVLHWESLWDATEDGR